MKTPRPGIVDFETDKIEGRPKYPPRPVGVSIKWPGKPCKYHAWGHPTKNNCTREFAAGQLRAMFEAHVNGLDLLFHNGKFDVDVAQTEMGLDDIALDWERLHDTMFLAFLIDPYAWELGLKPFSEKWLGLPPDERDEVFEWLEQHQKELKVSGLLPVNKRITKSKVGEFISLAPGDIVGRYANGDILRTDKLFQLLWPMVRDAGMLPAYLREQRVMPMLLQNEREGMRCNAKALRDDLPVYEAAMVMCERWLRKRLKVPDLDFNKDQDVAEALDRCGIISEWTLTKTGKLSMDKKVLKPAHFNDHQVFCALGYRNKAETCVTTYYRPWLKTAEASGGILYAGWNQTRNDKDAGARTGRLSSSPNFMAVAKSFEDKGDGWDHPDFIPGLPHLPLMRQYLLPDSPKHWWGRRDYNQQELRLLAHFEGGQLVHDYCDNPRFDVHKLVQTGIKDLLGTDLPRLPIKQLNFGLIYGQGVPATAERIGRTIAEATAFRKSQFAVLPGVQKLDAECKKRGRMGNCITTWGGRQYFAEEGRVIDGRWRTFEYRLLNYLIQGSAADCTKEALYRYWREGYGDARFLVAVHDEINISAPKGAFKREMLRLRDIMSSVEFDVPMVSDAEFGPDWGHMAALKEPAFDYSRWQEAA